MNRHLVRCPRLVYDGHLEVRCAYFYLPYGKYRMNGKSCVVNETGVHFPGMVIIVK